MASPPITCLSDLLPGDVGFSTIGGRLGRSISIGQALLRDECIFSHAYLVLDDGWLIEAMPRGARIVRLSGDDKMPPRWGPQFAYGRVPLSDAQRGKVDRLARHGLWTPSVDVAGEPRFVPRLAGRPYGFDDYLALALWEWQLPGASLVRNRVARSDRLICSQLVDLAWNALGYQLFDDGRLPGDVTPGGLFWQVLRTGVVSVPAG